MSDDANIAIFQSLLPHASLEDAKHYLELAGGDAEVAAAIYSSEKPAAPVATTNASSRVQAPASTPAKKSNKPQEYFAGGSTNSGTAVLGPPGEGGSSGSGRDVASGIIDLAKDQGTRGPPPGEATTFGGSGRRLGHTEGASLPVNTGVRGEKTIKLTFYENGFIVEDGPLRSFDEPANKQFLEILKQGRVPPELAQQYPNADISVAIADHKDETYVAPFKAFSGSGKALSGGEGSSSPATHDTTPFEEMNVEDTLPTANVALQLLDGTRMEVKCNPSVHTINHLRTIAAKARPNTPPFELWARDIPPRPLPDLSATIEAARCVRCIVFMKKK